jgi:hypothetical protein
MAKLPFHIEQPFHVFIIGLRDNPISQCFIDSLKGKKIFIGTKEQLEQTGFTFDLAYNGSHADEIIDQASTLIEI